MRAYSRDLRTKIVEALQRGISKAQAVRLFGVSLSSVKRYARMARQGHSLAPKKMPGRPQKIGEDAQRLLEEDIKERPTGAPPRSVGRGDESFVIDGWPSRPAHLKVR
jgi:transposase